MQNAETPVQGETQSAEALGTTQPQATGTESTEAPESTSGQPEVSLDEVRAQLEAERKERQKLEMRARQLENQQKEADLRKLEETENYKELADTYKQELEQIRQEREAREALDEARKFRQEAIAAYPDPATREAASKLIAKNENALAWGDVQSWDEAKASLYEQLDALKEVVSPEQAAPTVHPNNPQAETQSAPLDRSAAINQAARNRDFSELLKTIPSVQAQIKALDE